MKHFSKYSRSGQFSVRGKAASNRSQQQGGLENVSGCLWWRNWMLSEVSGWIKFHCNQIIPWCWISPPSFFQFSGISSNYIWVENLKPRTFLNFPLGANFYNDTELSHTYYYYVLLDLLTKKRNLGRLRPSLLGWTLLDDLNLWLRQVEFSWILTFTVNTSLYSNSWLNSKVEVSWGKPTKLEFSYILTFTVKTIIIAIYDLIQR